MKPLHTIDAVADHFGLTPDQVVRRCRASLGAWPHMRPNNSDSSTWRFSDEDIELIEARIARRTLDVDSWGRTQKKAS